MRKSDLALRAFYLKLCPILRDRYGTVVTKYDSLSFELLQIYDFSALLIIRRLIL